MSGIRTIRTQQSPIVTQPLPPEVVDLIPLDRRPEPVGRYGIDRPAPPPPPRHEAPLAPEPAPPAAEPSEASPPAPLPVRYEAPRRRRARLILPTLGITLLTGAALAVVDRQLNRDLAIPTSMLIIGVAGLALVAWWLTAAVLGLGDRIAALERTAMAAAEDAAALTADGSSVAVATHGVTLNISVASAAARLTTGGPSNGRR